MLLNLLTYIFFLNILYLIICINVCKFINFCTFLILCYVISKNEKGYEFVKWFRMILYFYK